MLQVIKQNINIIDYSLKEKFDSVLITESGNSTGFTFNINASKTVDNKTYSIIIEMNQNDLIGNNINWNYKENPFDSESNIIERASFLDSFVNDVDDVILKKRFSSDYLSNIKENSVIINESKIEVEDTDIINKINNIFIYQDVVPFSEIKKEISFNENVDIFIKTPYKLRLSVSEPLKESVKLKLENEIMKIQFVDYVSFKIDNSIEISVTE